MSDILNIAKIKSKMKEKPVGQRLYLFFDGQTTLLNKRQIKEVQKIIEKENEGTAKFLQEALASAK